MSLRDDDRAFNDAHASLLRHGDIQFSMTRYEEPKPPEWLIALGNFLRDHATEIKWGFWIVAGVIVAVVLYNLARAYLPMLTNRQKKPARTVHQEQWRPTEAEARQLLAESDALAATGDYAEAVHLLLLRSIADLDERRPRQVRPTLTSREIERLSALPDAPRSAFSAIARVVERAMFAGHDIGAAEFARCRREYEAFAFAPAWSS